LPWVALGDFPTPVTRLNALAGALGMPDLELYEKRDDSSSGIYGGNKVRTLEVLFGGARADGATHVFSTGAFGSNHAVATVLHASRAGLLPGVILFPQPVSWAALENFRVALSARPVLRILRHWSSLPLGMAWTLYSERARGHRPFIMVPGGATPLGALGYVSAALELGMQIEAGVLPRPRQVLIGVGSTCTSAGLLVGFAHAARLGIGFRSESPPELVSVRVTPWPVTSKVRIVGLAVRASRLLARLCSRPELELSRSELAPHLTVTGAYLGRGYGEPTAEGRSAMQLWDLHANHSLDTTYSAKAAAALVAAAQRGPRGPILLWATKSSAPLPEADRLALLDAPRLAREWMVRAERQLEAAGELPPSAPRLDSSAISSAYPSR
jgi:D-cysteine desulfhydrase